MVMICHCRGITDTRLKETFDTIRANKLEAADVSLDDLVPHLGEFNCGGCKRIFQRAADQYNVSGEANLFKRSATVAPSGLCSKALETTYSVNGIPELRGSPIENDNAPA